MTPAIPDAPEPSLLRRFWAPPEPIFLEAGAKGELLVAKIRLALVALLLVIPVSSFVRYPDAQESHVGLGVALAALALALIVYLVVKRDHDRRWIGFGTSILDVSLVSGALATFLVLDTPHTAVNSKVVFEAYFLALGATCLRYDVRVCLVSGALALAQYGAIVWYAETHWDLNSPEFAPFPYGMYDRGAQFSRLILLFAMAALSVAIVVRGRRLRRLSTSDRLTGLANRGHFDEQVGIELSRARRYGSPLSIAMIDVDHFKRFNDTFGHAAGDVALRAIADAIRGSIRRSDLAARYGGEEFVVIFPETGADAAIEKLEAIRRRVEGLLIAPPRRQPVTGLTISAGVASRPQDGEDPEVLLDCADARLFKAKRAGRNRVVGPPERSAGESRHSPAASA
ncbi:MAG TPA: GGDEF domain-containing protein [Gemmatimonadales bacterium]|nr:GGDEF domain-containing protein [Gemmatimonadales bacterium]